MSHWMDTLPMEWAFTVVVLLVFAMSFGLGWLVGRLGNDWKVQRIAAGLRAERGRRIEMEAQLLRLTDPLADDIPPGEHLPTGVDVWLRDYLRE